MAKKTKKGTKGTAVNYMTRGQALSKLQVPLKVFRRLCILKGIHPREPRKKLHGHDKTYYHAKDIKWLMHEPLLDKLRKQTAYEKKIRRAIGKCNVTEARRLSARRPKCRLDHLIRERYPSFMDALRDLDDALTMIHLFSVLPSAHKGDQSIPASLTNAARRLSMEFDAYIVKTNSLRKIFVSVRGFYYQAEIMGQAITWLSPHTVQQVLPSNVDYSVLATFMEFYKTFLEFVNFKLYNTLGLVYPPPKDPVLEKGAAFLESIMVNFAKSVEEEHQSQTSVAAIPNSEKHLSGLRKKIKEIADKVIYNESIPQDDGDILIPESLNNNAGEGSEEVEDDSGSLESMSDEDEPASLKSMSDKDEDEPGSPGSLSEEDLDGERDTAVDAAGEKAAGATVNVDVGDDAAICQNLFRGLVFFLGRECPMQPLLFTIRAFGGTVGWEGTGSPFEGSDISITHEICDRPIPPARSNQTREIMQPQWVFDSCNSRVLLPIGPYYPGKLPPPHLSPFVTNYTEGYMPDYAKTIKEIQDAANVARTINSTLPQNAQETATVADLELQQLTEIEEAESLERAYRLELAQEIGEEQDTNETKVADVEKPKKRKKRTLADVADESKAMSEIMIPSKHRYLYKLAKKKEARTAARIEQLESRREAS